MSFLNNLTAQLKNFQPNIAQVVEKANQAKQNLAPIINKCTQQIDAISKFLPVPNSTKQSPIDLLPISTVYEPSFENSTFTYNYNEICQIVVKNTGAAISLCYPETNNIDFVSSLFPEQQYHLEQIDFHWGTEPMNGSEHTVAGVGYAGEVHFIHRNIKYPNLEVASKQPDGIVGIAVFLNESHDDNLNLIPLMNVISHVTFSNTQCMLQNFRATGFLPSLEKAKEFWVYDGSETTTPFRSMKWILFRSTIGISSGQLEKFRQLKGTRSEEEVEKELISIRPIQPLNSRMIKSSFKSVAQATLDGLI